MKRVVGALLALTIALGASLPAQAATVRPSETLHYVYNCTQPTVEVDFFKLGGVRDVYVHTDQGYWLIAQNVTFDTAKVYDGYWHLGGVMQVDIFVTNAGAGPYANHVVGKSTAATSLCPTYYPVYDSHWVDPTPPAGSVPIEFSYIQQYRNIDGD